ncbi:MAG: PAS domain S-box protein [Pseudomonadota bacterium]
MDGDRTAKTALPSWYEVQRLGRDRGSFDQHAEAARVYRGLFESLLEGLQAGVAIIDNGTGALIFINGALARILGGEQAEILGTHYLEHVAPEDRERIRDYHRRRILGDPTLPPRYEMLLTTRGDERRVVDFSMGPIRFSDAIVVFMRDVTEEKLYHEPLIHLQKMEGMSNLVGRIAHEFNNLLASVLGHTSLLKSRIGGDGDLEPLVLRVEQATLRAREVLGQLLELGGGRGTFFNRISGPCWPSASSRSSMESGAWTGSGLPWRSPRCPGRSGEISTCSCRRSSSSSGTRWMS